MSSTLTPLLHNWEQIPHCRETGTTSSPFSAIFTLSPLGLQKASPALLLYIVKPRQPISFPFHRIWVLGCLEHVELKLLNEPAGRSWLKLWFWVAKLTSARAVYSLPCAARLPSLTSNHSHPFLFIFSSRRGRQRIRDASIKICSIVKLKMR